MECYFLYLVQGQSKLVKEYFHLNRRKNAHAFFLTYDQRLEGAIYFPNSTWAEGRNRLLDEVLKSKINYNYIIFCDDDIHFYHGDWGEFESSILKYLPKVAVPVFDRTSSAVLPYPAFEAQSFTFNDEQLMAFSRGVVEERKVLPYQTKFDNIHWWATCRLQQILIRHFYRGHILQFNKIRVSNMQHERYQCDNVAEDDYAKEVLACARSSYSNVKDINKFPSKTKLFYETIVTSLTLKKSLFILNISTIKNLCLSFTQTRNEITEDELPSLIDNKFDWVIYGFGDIGQRVFQSLDYVGKSNDIVKIVDRRAYSGKFTINGVNVDSPDSLKEIGNPRVIVASYSFIEQILFFLIKQLHMNSKEIFILKK